MDCLNDLFQPKNCEILQNDDMSRTCGLSAKCYQDFTSAFWPFSQVFKQLLVLYFYKHLFLFVSMFLAKEDYNCSKKSFFQAVRGPLIWES